MIRSKSSRSALGLAFIGFITAALVGLAGLAVFVDELAESGRAVPNLAQGLASLRAAWQNSSGNEFTGEATAWLFAASSVPVGIDWIARTSTRYGPFGENVKRAIRRINNLQRKYLMPFHTYLSLPALGLGLLHLVLSSCAANPLPELGLILTGILVVTGLLFKCKAVSVKFRRVLYQFHASLLVTGTLLVILYSGHALMELD